MLLAFLLVTLLVAGGASRADAMGQTIVRGSCSVILVLLILLADRPPAGGSRTIPLFLFTSLGLVLLQLVPLPPAVWQGLPGRGAFTAAAGGGTQPWRPWAIVPGAALNAATSLIVPITTLVLLKILRPVERAWLPGLLLGLIAASMLLGLLQLSGGRLDNPLINDTPGQISGSFANRNHFALFLAFGCLLAPVWAFSEKRRLQWRAPVALGFSILFPLMILATGSRAGMLLGVAALASGLIMVRHDLKMALRSYPRWVFPTLVAGLIGSVLLLGLATALAGRALSIDRVIENDLGQDMRARALPVVLSMVRDYLPAGAGFGSFDPLFRIYEPFALLKLTYFNHAHNDWLEIVLDGGLPGLLLLLAGVVWWARASIRAWRSPEGAERDPLPRLGSVILLLVFVASVFDYPARTPTVMMMIVVAATWLSGEGRVGTSSALPKSDEHL